MTYIYTVIFYEALLVTNSFSLDHLWQEVHLHGQCDVVSNSSAERGDDAVFGGSGYGWRGYWIPGDEASQL